MIAIIPARGGSKRLPGKNIKLLHGKPLIAYTIEAALKSKYITRVLVSTDDKEIADVAIQYGADVPELRPDFLATDNASSNDVIKYTLDLVKSKYNEINDNCVLLQPTSPLRNSRHIDEAIDLFLDKEADSVISFTKEYHPLKWNKYINENGKLEDIEGLDDRVSYFPNGAIYVLSFNAIENADYYINSIGYVMERNYSIDIDTQEDWDLCDFILKKEL